MLYMLLSHNLIKLCCYVVGYRPLGTTMRTVKDRAQTLCDPCPQAADVHYTKSIEQFPSRERGPKVGLFTCVCVGHVHECCWIQNI